MASAPPQTDVIVVGGGIAGLTTATQLAKKGRKVVLLERGSCTGDWRQASSVNCGLLESWSALPSDRSPDELLPNMLLHKSSMLLHEGQAAAFLNDVLCAGSFGFYAQLAKQPVDIEYAHTPALEVRP
jgi:glycine/D-amino acid oxidase-like deaminating enzyme